MRHQICYSTGQSKLIRIVVDTNVLISGAFFSGAPSQIIDACVNGQFTLVLSPDIIDENQRVGEIFTKKQ
ncbi:PIN domain-containing protein, partial [bacterium]|nr:PIN domain-containing protein [bacterium]